jgi:hypothetical protein
MGDPLSTVVGRSLAAGDASNVDASDDLLHPDAVSTHLRAGPPREIADIAAPRRVTEQLSAGQPADG